MTLSRPQKQPASIGEQPHLPGIVERLGEPAAEVGAQRVHQLLQVRRREPVPAEIGQDHQLDDVDRRIAALGEPARRRAARRDRGWEHPARVPPLELSRGEPRQSGHFTGAIAGFELHIRR